MEIETRHHNKDVSVRLASGRKLRVPAKAFAELRKVGGLPGAVARMYHVSCAEFFIGGNGKQREAWLKEWFAKACYCGYRAETNDEETCPDCGNRLHEQRIRGDFRPYIGGRELAELCIALAPGFQRLVLGDKLRDGPFFEIAQRNIRGTRPFKIFRAGIEGMALL